MNRPLHAAPNACRGFTLVELMVTLVIIAILSSLSLAGLNGARHRSKIAKTKSTLQKLNNAIVTHYDSYVSRRVPTIGGAPTAVATDRLRKLRLLLTHEMPDGWGDVFVNVPAVNSLAAANDYLKTAPVRAYAAFRASAVNLSPDVFGNAECLHMIVSRSGFDSSWLEMFRDDEMGDADGDNAREFRDGWNRPIRYIRWAPGFASPIQQLNTPDPLDPLRVSGTPGNPDPQLIPLIFSSGPDGASAVAPDEGYGITGPPAGGWAAVTDAWFPPLQAGPTTRPASVAPLPGSVSVGDPAAARDNITNHDLSVR